jgi:hypothetical protein
MPAGHAAGRREADAISRLPVAFANSVGHTDSCDSDECCAMADYFVRTLEVQHVGHRLTARAPPC